MDDDATRRKLRFSLFLQCFAIFMLGASAAIRIFAFGIDIVSALLLIAMLVVIGAAGYTWTKMKALSSVN